MAAEDIQLWPFPTGSFDEKGAGEGDPLWQQRDAGVQLLHTQRQLGHAGHHDPLQIGVATDVQQAAVFPVFHEGASGVIPVLRQRQAGDLRELPIHQGDQLAAAGEIADQVAKGGRQEGLNKITFRLTRRSGLGGDGRINISGDMPHRQGG